MNLKVKWKLNFSQCKFILIKHFRINAYSEKIQSKLVIISTQLIKSSFNRKINESNRGEDTSQIKECREIPNSSNTFVKGIN